METSKNSTPTGAVNASISPTSLRSRFAASLSELYREEVPLYASLVDLVNQINDSILAADPNIRDGLFPTPDSRSRLKLERHGAIRLANHDELSQLARFLALMDMHPVGYYDLNLPPAYLPIHATCFRSFSTESLEISPFRLFVSVLRQDLLKNVHKSKLDHTQIQKLIDEALSTRPANLFSENVQTLIKSSNPGDQFTPLQADTLISDSIPTFRFRHSSPLTSSQYYGILQDSSAVISGSLRLGPGAPALLTDILSFPHPHINHLTPRTLSIDTVQSALLSSPQFPAKESGVEGPPGYRSDGFPRRCPVLLRQTSFCALREDVYWADGKQGGHQARFGEIEQRGAAVTRLGRQLYDEYLANVARGRFNDDEKVKMFEEYFPDDWEELRTRGLIWVRYRSNTADNAQVDLERPLNDLRTSGEQRAPSPKAMLELLITTGTLIYTPLTYEDFLPLSAAGIFKSNLSGRTPGVDCSKPSGHPPSISSTGPDINRQDTSFPEISREGGHKDSKEPARAQFEDALKKAGTTLHDEMDIYQQLQESSLSKCLADLNI